MATRHFAAGIIFAVFFTVTGVFAPPASAEIVRAVEFYHQAFEHYFVTANPAEIAALDSGMFQGWWRTGQRYRVDDAPAADLIPVCRFYTSAFAAKGSHFFTASAAECAYLKASPVWTYEGVAFFARVPDAQGMCGVGQAAIHRLFNNGRGGAPNHAYTADGAKRDTLVGAGWVSEGVAYCTPLAVGDPLAQTQVLAGSKWDLPSSMAIYGVGRIQTQFQFSQTLSLGDYKFADFGLPLPPAWIYHEVNFVFNGSAAWDSLSGSYISVESSGFEGDYAAGVAWTFDDAYGPATPVCTMSVYRNLLSVEPYRLHPFQTNLWSGCEPGVAYRS